MTGMDLVTPFARMLEASCPPATVRAIEAGGDYSALWDEIEASGFLDALVPEGAGGVGLALSDIAPLVQVTGRYAVPLPIGDTIIARYLIAANGQTAPRGPIALGNTGAGEAAAFVLGDADGELVLTATADDSAPASMGPASDGGLRPLAALVRAAQMAGAAAALLETTTAYANDRVQFGKPIGRQQAIQQQLAVMAEHCVGMRVAADIGFAAGLPLRIEAVATAKAITSASAPLVANTAHAVHGAIGISEECDVQLFTRRLHRWRFAAGSEAFWEERLGAIRLTGDAQSVCWLAL